MSLRLKPTPVTGTHYHSMRNKKIQKDPEPVSDTFLVELMRLDMQTLSEKHVRKVPGARAAHLSVGVSSAVTLVL